MILKLRDIHSDFAGFSFLASLAAQAKRWFFHSVEVDFSDVNWFDANMSAPLGVILTRIGDAPNAITVLGLKPGIKKILAKNRFLVGYGLPQKEDTHQTTIPYTRYKPEEIRSFADYLKRHLSGKGLPEMTPSLQRRFEDSILELFNNAAFHSETDLGIFACGQFFPNRHRLDFCIADAGVGFRRKIKKELGLSLRSDTAIRWALQEGHTTRTGSIPGGLGLKLLQTFIRQNKGRLQIVSDRGYWEWTADGESVQRFTHPFPGTVINLEINTADRQSYCLSSEEGADNLF